MVTTFPARDTLIAPHHPPPHPGPSLLPLPTHPRPYWTPSFPNIGSPQILSRRMHTEPVHVRTMQFFLGHIPNTHTRAHYTSAQVRDRVTKERYALKKVHMAAAAQRTQAMHGEDGGVNQMAAREIAALRGLHHECVIKVCGCLCVCLCVCV